MTVERPEKQAPSRVYGRVTTWVQADWFCPNCGKRDTWQEVGTGGDYYHDCTVSCFSCGHVMCCVSSVERGTPLPEPPS